MLRSQLLDLLVEGEKRQYDASEKDGNASVRGVCVDW